MADSDRQKIKQNGNDSNFAVDGRGRRPAPVCIGGAEAGEEGGRGMNMTTRRLVYDKYGGRCAYCGKELRFEDMQVDHIVPVWRGRDHETLSKMVAIGDDSVENLNPSCRACNFRKGTNSVEDFRRILREQCQGIMKRSFQVRQSLDFGLLEWHDMDVVFFFESYGQGGG